MTATLDTRHAEVVDLVTKGLSSREIAARLEVKRNTLLGYCQRNGIRFRQLANNHPSRRVPPPKPKQRTVLDYNVKSLRKRRKAAREGKTALYDGVRDLRQELYPEPLGIHLVDAGPFQCRRPTWGPDERIGPVCGRPVKPDSSYCLDCHARLPVKPEKRK